MSLGTAMEHLSTTMDLAAGKQIGLAEAATAVGKAYSGQEGALSRMGIVIEKSVPKSEQFAVAMEKIGEKFGGAAQKDVETYAGKQAQVANAMDNLKEKIGGALIPVMNTFQDMMGNVVKGADQLVTQLGEAWKVFTEIPEVKTIAESLSGAFADLQKGFGVVAEELGRALLPLFKELWDALKGVWDALKPVIDAFGEIWKAIVGVGKDGKETYNIFKLLADVLKLTIVPALTALVEGIKLVTPVIKLLAEGFKTAVEIAIPAICAIIEGVTSFITTIKDLLGGFYKWLVGGSFIQDTMAAAFTAFEAGSANSISGVSKWLGGIMDTFLSWGKGLTDFFGGIWNTMVDSVGKAISSITSEVRTGTDDITKLMSNLQTDLVGESIWTDMWGDMVRVTSDGFDQILVETQAGVRGLEGTLAGARVGLVGSAAVGFPAAAASAPAMTNVTVHISMGTVQVSDKTQLDDFLATLHRQIVDAVRAR